MIELKLDSCPSEDKFSRSITVPFHSSIRPTHENLNRWIDRFSQFIDNSIINDLVLFFSLAKKKYLDHRNPEHLARLVLSIYHTRRKILSASSLHSSTRHLMIRWLPTNLLFPFSFKPVLGCLIGFNLMNRCELFDEENILVSLQKHFPSLQFVKESYYSHTSQNENTRICYFEVEKKDGSRFTLSERRAIINNFSGKIKNSIQKLIPSMFMKLNQEEIYKNILILSQEITSINDLPQVCITLDQHTGKEIVFHITLVQISAQQRFHFKDHILGNPFILERTLPVRHLDGHQIEASLFKLYLQYEPSLIRSDGSLDFYAARQKATTLLLTSIGEFRDYNGGLLIKQQELLFSLKQNLPQQVTQDSELMETFFHALVPLEKQALLDPNVLSALFIHYINHRQEKLTDGFSFKIHHEPQRIYLSIRSDQSSIRDTLNTVLRNHLSTPKEWAYNILETSGDVSFNCVLLNPASTQAENFIQILQDALSVWNQKRQKQQTLRIALGHSMFSLDPRIGGENVSSEVLRLLFEGLTRFNQHGLVENAVAESINISSDLKRYVFKLRPSFWNDGTLVSAHDFAYSWKRILSPDFKTNFADFFYPIQNAKEAKEGKVHSDQIGVVVIDDRTLQVDLVRPTPYFLELTTLPFYSPIHRFIDQERPQWLYQAGKHYPCNGPYQLKVNQPNESYHLIKNPLYRDSSQIELDQITLTSMDSFHAMQAFAKNEIDWVGDPFGAWNSFTVPEEGRYAYSPNTCLCWLVFNTSIPPFNNPKIRQALSLAIDRLSLIKEVSLPWTPAHSVLFPLNQNDKRMVFPNYDPEKSIQLLHEALSEVGLNIKDLQIQLTVPQKSMSESAALQLKRQFKMHLGIECQLQCFSWNLFFHKITEGQFQAGLINWMSPTKDPISTLNTFKFANGGVNFSRWEQAEFQQLLDLSEKELSLYQRSAYLYKAEEILAKEMPIIPLFYQPDQAIIRKNFRINYQLNQSGYFNQSKFFT